MFSAPPRMILEPLQPMALIPGNPLSNRCFRQQQNTTDLVVPVSLRHQDQRVIALPLVKLRPFILVPPTRFGVIFGTEHSLLLRQTSLPALYIPPLPKSWCVLDIEERGVGFRSLT